MPHPALTSGAVAVVTGGAAGIGLAAAKRFAVLGLRVCIADLGRDRLDKAAKEIGAVAPGGGAGVMAMEADVGDVAAVTALEAAVRERFGGTDVLMNNAGIQPGSGVFGPPENWARILGVNLWGVIHGIQAFVPAHDRPRPARTRHQHRLEAGHHHAAGRSRLQRRQGRREGLHRGLAARAAQHAGLQRHARIC